MTPKILVLIIADNSLPVYRECIKVWKQYMNRAQPNIHCLFLFGDPSIEPQWMLDPSDTNGNSLLLKCQDGFIPGILQKTLMAIEYLYDGKQLDATHFDYVLRTNLSSFWVWDRLLEFASQLPKEKVYAGVTGPNFVSGAGMLMSMDIVKMLYDHRNMLVKSPIIDDVAIGDFLIVQNGIKPIVMTRFDFIHNQFASPQLITDVMSATNQPKYYHVRVKNDADRLRFDVSILNLLLNQVYLTTS